MKVICLFFVLFLGTTAMAQQDLEVDFDFFSGNNNKIFIRYFMNQETPEKVGVLYSFDNSEMQNLEISLDEYNAIIEDIHKIELSELLNENRQKNHESLLTLRVRNMNHEISINIANFNQNSLDEKYKSIRTATQKILASIGLSLKDLK
jgi:DNA repair ATPase RecN